VALALRLAKRMIKAEFSKKRCVFCGEKIPADEHSHHLEICSLKIMSMLILDTGVTKHT
jgi:hypothetical protein